MPMTCRYAYAAAAAHARARARCLRCVARVLVTHVLAARPGARGNRVPIFAPATNALAISSRASRCLNTSYHVAPACRSASTLDTPRGASSRAVPPSRARACRRHAPRGFCRAYDRACRATAPVALPRRRISRRIARPVAATHIAARRVSVARASTLTARASTLTARARLASSSRLGRVGMCAQRFVGVTV